MQRNALERKEQSIFMVDTLQSAYRNIIAKRLDPLVVSKTSDASVVPEHRYFTDLLNNLGIITQAVKEISKRSTLITKLSSMISWSSSLRNSRKELKENFNELQSSVNLNRLVILFENLIHDVQLFAVKMLDIFDRSVDFLLLNKSIISHAEDDFSVLIDEIKGNEFLKAYQHVGGISGVARVFDIVQKMLPKTHEIKNSILEIVSHMNHKIKEIILTMDEVEIIFGLEEGAIVKILDEMIKKYRDPDKEEVTVSSFFLDIQDALAAAGYEFDENNKYPFLNSKLKQRRLLLKWLPFCNSAEKLAFNLENILSFSCEGWEEFNAVLPILISQYDIDAKLKQKFIASITVESKNFDDAEFSDTYLKIVQALKKEPTGTTLVTQLGIKLLAQRYNLGLQQKAESEEKEFKKYGESILQRNGLIIYAIDSRITQLREELECYLFYTSRRTKLKKIRLLTEIKNIFNNNMECSFFEAINLLKNPQDIDLLFEGRTGEIINRIKRTLSSRADMIELIQIEIDRLQQTSGGFYFFANRRRAAYLLRISALEKFKEKVTIQGVKINDALDEIRSEEETLIRENEKSLLTELRQIEQAIPENFRDKRLVR